METLKGRKVWGNVLQVLWYHRHQPDDFPQYKETKIMHAYKTNPRENTENYTLDGGER